MTEKKREKTKKTEGKEMNYKIIGIGEKSKQQAKTES